MLVYTCSFFAGLDKEVADRARDGKVEPLTISDARQRKFEKRLGLVQNRESVGAELRVEKQRVARRNDLGK